jgi:hypothetical protein
VAEYVDSLDAEVKRQAQAESDSDNGMDEGEAECQPPHRKAPMVKPALALPLHKLAGFLWTFAWHGCGAGPARYRLVCG